jgi:hypothetical protein
MDMEDSTWMPDRFKLEADQLKRFNKEESSELIKKALEKRLELDNNEK